MNRMLSFSALQPEPTDQLDPVVLEGLKVRLEPLAPRHLTGLEKAARDPMVFRWFADPPSRMDDFIARALGEQVSGQSLAFAVIGREANQPIGSTRFRAFSARHRHAEIDLTWLAPDSRGKGYGLEMASLMLRHAFEVWGLMRIAFRSDDADEGAARMLARIGAAREGVERNHMRRFDGTWRHSVMHAVIADDWPAVRANLKAQLAR